MVECDCGRKELKSTSNRSLRALLACSPIRRGSFNNNANTFNLSKPAEKAWKTSL